MVRVNHTSSQRNNPDLEDKDEQIKQLKTEIAELASKIQQIHGMLAKRGSLDTADKILGQNYNLEERLHQVEILSKLVLLESEQEQDWEELTSHQ